MPPIQAESTALILSIRELELRAPRLRKHIEAACVEVRVRVEAKRSPDVVGGHAAAIAPRSPLSLAFCRGFSFAFLPGFCEEEAYNLAQGKDDYEN